MFFIVLHVGSFLMSYIVAIQQLVTVRLSFVQSYQAITFLGIFNCMIHLIIGIDSSILNA